MAGRRLPQMEAGVWPRRPRCPLVLSRRRSSRVQRRLPQRSVAGAAPQMARAGVPRSPFRAVGGAVARVVAAAAVAAVAARPPGRVTMGRQEAIAAPAPSSRRRPCPWSAASTSRSR